MQMTIMIDDQRWGATPEGRPARRTGHLLGPVTATVEAR